MRIEGRITGREHLWWWGDAATIACDGIDGDSTELISEVRVHDKVMIDYMIVKMCLVILHNENLCQ